MNINKSYQQTIDKLCNLHYNKDAEKKKGCEPLRWQPNRRVKKILLKGESDEQLKAFLQNKYCMVKPMY